jgi:hypothetical protein
MSTSFGLSTSNITGSGWGNTSEWWGGFAPWYGVEDSYGCCYTLSPNRIKVFMTCWTASAKSDVHKMDVAFQQAMLDIGKVIGVQVPKGML